MSDHNQRDNQSGQQNVEQFNQAFTTEGQDFVYTEETKPINRNLVVLVLIAAVGGALIYLMYLRGRFNAADETIELAKARDTVINFVKDGSGAASLKQMEEQLKQTEKSVNSISAAQGLGQVAPEDLKSNPFSTGEKPQAAVSTPQQPSLPQADPLEDVNRALQKVKVEMILYSGLSSTATINNWVYKIGDRITVDSIVFTVKAIGRSSVVLKHPMGEFTVGTPGAMGM